MFRFDADFRTYLHREPIDLRAGLNTLVTMVEKSMQLDPLAPSHPSSRSANAIA